nr:hypothetical protein B0A51_06961 [Rachicladosporium sp. CCFEE 5018]
MDPVGVISFTLIILIVVGGIYTYVSSTLIPIHADPSRETQARRQINHVAVEGLGESAEGIDIIFVHGLGSNPDTTWTARTLTSHRVNWVTELLPNDLKPAPNDLKPDLRPHTRLYFFNYDTDWRRAALKIELKDVAADLLSELIKLAQDSTHHGLSRPRRSFILVAHSFGGLVVKKAVAEAPDDVLDSVRGVVCLGTPHSGVKSAWISKLIAQSWWLLGANAAIFDELRHGSLYLREIQRSYRRATKIRKLRTFNFFEQRPTRFAPFYSEILVPEADATYGDPDDETTNMGMPTDHSGLNKFASNRSPGYDKIRLALVDILGSVVTEMRTNARSRHVVPETLNDQNISCVQLLGPSASQISIGPMSTDEAVQLLSSTIGLSDCKAEAQHPLEHIAGQMGGLPLALDIAGTIIRNSIMDGAVVAAIQRYADDYRDHRDEMLKSEEFRGLHHSRQTVWTAWNSAFAAIGGLSSDHGFLSLTLLSFMAFFAPSGVQSRIFEIASMDLADHDLGDNESCDGASDDSQLWYRTILKNENGSWDRYWYSQTTAILCRFHLLQKAPHDPETFVMHDLIRWRAQQGAMNIPVGPSVYVEFIVAVCRQIGKDPGLRFSLGSMDFSGPESASHTQQHDADRSDFA